MNLTLIPVDHTNRALAESLNVADFQKHFIESVQECMAEADEIPDWEPVLIMEGQQALGFSMYGLMRREINQRLWFDRLLIDRRFQHRGYGRAAAELILKTIKAEYPGRDIYLSAYEDNSVAIELYKSLGFEFNGELDYNGEKIMLLKA